MIKITKSQNVILNNLKAVLSRFICAEITDVLIATIVSKVPPNEGLALTNIEFDRYGVLNKLLFSDGSSIPFPVEHDGG